MAAIFHAIFGCCCGERDKSDPQDRRPLLNAYESRQGADDPHGPHFALPGEEDERTLDLNQKVADIVSNGSRRMLTPALSRPNAGVYSPVLGAASTSQANITGARTPHTQRSQPESRHSSQSSRHSSYKQHQPSLLPHAELEGAPLEVDTASALDALNTSFSLASQGGNKPRQEHANYGSIAYGGPLGATATSRRFQIHVRGRPPSRKGNSENDNTAQPQSRANGVQPFAEPTAHEVKQQRPTPEASPIFAKDENSPTTSSPLRINQASNEGSSSAERGPDVDEKRKVHFEIPPGDVILRYD